MCPLQPDHVDAMPCGKPFLLGQTIAGCWYKLIERGPLVGRRRGGRHVRRAF